MIRIKTTAFALIGLVGILASNGCSSATDPGDASNDEAAESAEALSDCTPALRAVKALQNFRPSSVGASTCALAVEHYTPDPSGVGALCGQPPFAGQFSKGTGQGGRCTAADMAALDLKWQNFMEANKNRSGVYAKCAGPPYCLPVHLEVTPTQSLVVRTPWPAN